MSRATLDDWFPIGGIVMEHQLHEGSDKCMNEPCHCTVTPGQQYCSQYCEAEAATGKTARACDCGHSWCQEART